MENVILYLFGYAGTGKLTIAREVLKQYPFLLVDNHYINNVIFGLIDTDGNTPLPLGTWENVAKVRAAVFDTIQNLSRPERSFIFTNELLEGKSGDDKVFQWIKEIAAAREASFLPVRLLITPEELARRVVSPDRRKMLKSWDADEALWMAQEYEVYIPKDTDYLELEVTNLPPADAAQQIVDEVYRRFHLSQ